jgi:pSer/pThr/pTyr-binding forkhead associated (FHA) protein
MVQLRILSGKKAGEAYIARHFPVRIGRSPAADLRVEEDGVWEQHFELDFKPAEGFFLKAHPDALARINGETLAQARLKNGDGIEIGSLKLQFWLSETRQSTLRLREWLTWTGIVVVSLGQIWLIYLLLNV